jgi:hypothetical protein
MISLKNLGHKFLGATVGCTFAGVAARTIPSAIQFVTPRVTGLAAVAMGVPATALTGAGSLFIVPAAYRFGGYMYEEGTRKVFSYMQQACRSRQMRYLENPMTTIQRLDKRERILQDATFTTLFQEESHLENENEGENGAYEQIEFYDVLRTANQN